MNIINPKLLNNEIMSVRETFANNDVIKLENRIHTFLKEYNLYGQTDRAKSKLTIETRNILNKIFDIYKTSREFPFALIINTKLANLNILMNSAEEQFKPIDYYSTNASVRRLLSLLADD